MSERNVATKPSLFVVSLPRSLSTFTFERCRDALGLTAPEWAISGEILNHDLHRLSSWPKLADEGHKYITRECGPERFEGTLEFLDAATEREGAIYKDVVNPFVLAEWPGLQAFRVLKIRRDLSEVAEAMLRKGWHYPCRAAAETTGGPGPVARLAEGYLWLTLAKRALPVSHHGRWTARLRRDDVLRGLIRAEAVIERMPGETVEYSSLIRSEDSLSTALARLYGADAPGSIRYLDAAFEARRDRSAVALDAATVHRLGERIRTLRTESGAAVPERSAS